MRGRFALLSALVGVLVAVAVPAAAYWSQESTVGVTLEIAELPTLSSPVTTRSPDLGAVTVRWEEVSEAEVAASGYLIERALLDPEGHVDDGSWRALDGPVHCADLGCVTTDEEAPSAAAYRVTARAGASWYSAASPIAFSMVLHGVDVPPDPVGQAPSPDPTAQPVPPGAGCTAGLRPMSFRLLPAPNAVLEQRISLVRPGSDQVVIYLLEDDGSWRPAGTVGNGVALDLTHRVQSEHLVLGECGPARSAASAAQPALRLVVES